MNCFYTMEIEATNFCNACCEFCFNKQSKYEKGFIDIEEFKIFLKKQREMSKMNLLNDMVGSNIFPKIVFGGAGEPLLHPKIFELIAEAKNEGFYVSLITNGCLLTLDCAKKLIKSGLDELDVSLHTVNYDKYFNITQLRLEQFVEQMKSALIYLTKNNKVVYLWRIKALHEKDFDDSFDEKLYNSFCDECGIPKQHVLGPSLAWSRDGTVDSLCEKVHDDFFWCNKIAFTFNISWNGKVILCCNDYNRNSVDLGNAFEKDFDFQEYFNTIKAILMKKNIPKICKDCKRWKDEELNIISKKFKIDLGELWEKLKLE